MILSAAATGEIPGFNRVGKQRMRSFQSMLVIQRVLRGQEQPKLSMPVKKSVHPRITYNLLSAFLALLIFPPRRHVIPTNERGGALRATFKVRY